MRKPKVRTLTQKIPYAFRVGSDRQRAVYVAVRRALRPRLSGERRRLAAELARSASIDVPRERGFLVVPPGPFPEVTAVVAAAHAAVREGLAADRIARANKPFLAGMVDQSKLDLESPYLRLALRPDIIAAVSRYLGVVPILQYANVLYSGHVDADLAKSQLYHCDSDDTTQLKIFVHCTDVTPENGPLTMMSAAGSERLRRHLGYRYRFRVPDVDAAPFSTGDEHPMLGPAGTACFVDTSRCFHFGSRVSRDATPRVIMMLQYLTPYSFILPGDPRRAARFRRLSTPELPRLARLVLGGE